MDNTQWTRIVQACQQGDEEFISQIMLSPPENIRFNRLIKIALDHSQWNVVAQLLPVWNWNKSPRLFQLASVVPNYVAQQATKIVKKSADHRFFRKDCIQSVWRCVVRGNTHNLHFFIEQLSSTQVRALHDKHFWDDVGKFARPPIYDLLRQGLNMGSQENSTVLFSAIRYRNWGMADWVSSQVDHSDFLKGLQKSVELGEQRLIAQHLSNLSAQDLQHVVQQSLQSSFAVDRSKELNVWMTVLPSFDVLGGVIEEMFKVAIVSNNLMAVERLAQSYTPGNVVTERQHNLLGMVVNNLAGAFDPNHSVEMLACLLPRYSPDHLFVVRAVELAAERRGTSTLPHLDVLCSYSSVSNIMGLALSAAVIKNNASVVAHIMQTVDDDQFLYAIEKVKREQGALHLLSGWTRLEPLIQPRILQNAIENKDAPVVKRKM